MRHRPIWLLAGSVLLTACPDDSLDPEFPFDHEAIFVVRTNEAQHVDGVFEMPRVTMFRTQDVLGNLDVRALVIRDDEIYAGTGDGLFKASLDGEAFLQAPGVAGGIPALSLDGDDVLVATANGYLRLGPSVESFLVDTASASVSAIAAVGDDVYLGTDGDMFVHSGGGWSSFAWPQPGGVRALHYDGQTLWATGTNGGLYSIVGQQATFDSRPGFTEIDFYGLASRADGLWIAGQEYLVQAHDGVADEFEAGIDGLPTASHRTVAANASTILVGHEIGATAITGDNIDHYHSLRWIPDQTVTAVALEPDGTRWIGTPAGISRIDFVETTLSEKAERNEALIHERHWRMDGFVDDAVRYDDPWAWEGLRTGDHDNDGLWTEMQIGAWCYAYAVTKEERYYEAARKAMDVMMLQFEVPAETFKAAGMPAGFITRSLVRDDEGDVFSSKAEQSNWHLQEYQGRSYYWKDDTSSDEYAGHYVGIPLFYDLCAKDEAEKEALRVKIRSSTDYLIENDYVLIDLDGESTLHGHWECLGVASAGLEACSRRLQHLDPVESAAKCISSRHGAGWLNSTEILGHLLAAWHMTGDQKYYDEYERLHTEERYGAMIKIIDDTFTVTEPAFANHSDHELAMLGYITLMRYEPNEDRRAQYIQSLLDFYEYEREEHNPWQLAVIGGAYGKDVDLVGGIQTMMDMPNDWRTWLYDNGHRVDARKLVRDRHGSEQYDRVFPYDEIRTMKWNGSPYVVVGGSASPRVLAPTPYLLAYWTLRYHGMLAVD